MFGIKQLFHWCTSWSIGSGTSISYWYDAWDGPPRSLGRVPHQQQPNISLREAWPERDVIDPNSSQNDMLVFVDQQLDTITWRWEKCGIYTSKSVYKILKGGCREKWKFLTTW